MSHIDALSKSPVLLFDRCIRVSFRVLIAREVGQRGEREDDFAKYRTKTSFKYFSVCFGGFMIVITQIKEV